jgi:uncharacterized protein (UPF0548 family)
VSVRRLSEADVDRLRRLSLTYGPVDAASGAQAPPGYRHLSRTAALGYGRQCFDVASAAVMRWEMHSRAGITVVAGSALVKTGGVAILRLGLGPVAVTAPVRVVDVIAEPSRRGFAYGTLEGHPESGEESFVVALHDDESVTLTISAFSRPASLLARASEPIGALVQSWVTSRYLKALSAPQGR